MEFAADVVANLQAFTGLGEQEARMYLEMAGGDLEMATNLVFGGGDAGGGGGFGGADAGNGAGADPSLPPFFKVVWQDVNGIPDAWLGQTLAFTDDDADFGGLGIVQPKNGPCGVLAALHAILLKNVMQVRWERVCEVKSDVISPYCEDEGGECCLRGCARIELVCAVRRMSRRPSQ